MEYAGQVTVDCNCVFVWFQDHTQTHKSLSVLSGQLDVHKPVNTEDSGTDSHEPKEQDVTSCSYSVW